MSTPTQDPDALGAQTLTVALIGPEEQLRKSLARALAGPQASVTREFSSYPELDDVLHLLEGKYDVVIVELDSNPEHAFDLVETICGSSSSTVMVYSRHSDSEMLVRCMRAGAREYLTQPIAPGTLAEAFVRASVRRVTPRAPRKTSGKLLAFIGAKGGSGTTTIAANFAVALARESERSVLLVDLDLPFGNAALELGVSSQYSTINALQNSTRLDTVLLSKLLVKHASGLSVLPAPDRFVSFQAEQDAVDRLLALARQDFDYVVVDAGSQAWFETKPLHEEATTVYLVTQVSISELRNCNRLICEFFRNNDERLEIVLNRFSSKSIVLDEEHVTKALTRPAQWKVPNDYAAVRQAQSSATTLASAGSPISQVIRQMARTACGLPAKAEQKKRFGLFG